MSAIDGISVIIFGTDQTSMLYPIKKPQTSFLFFYNLE
jgi:hypothetical protein